MKYYILTNEIVQQYQGFQKENYAINFTQTNKGIWVINENCGEDIFTEIDWEKLKKIDLEITDFQPTYEDRPLIEGYRLVSVLDTYTEINPILITIFKNSQYYEFKRPYKNGTWTDATITTYITQYAQDNP